MERYSFSVSIIHTYDINQYVLYVGLKKNYIAIQFLCSYIGRYQVSTQEVTERNEGTDRDSTCRHNQSIASSLPSSQWSALFRRPPIRRTIFTALLSNLINFKGATERHRRVTHGVDLLPRRCRQNVICQRHRAT